MASKFREFMDRYGWLEYWRDHQSHAIQFIQRLSWKRVIQMTADMLDDTTYKKYIKRNTRYEFQIQNSPLLNSLNLSNHIPIKDSKHCITNVFRNICFRSVRVNTFVGGILQNV
jgi:hypothetical protein